MRSRRLGLLLADSGGGLLIATAAIHLDLYLTGYRTIPTIGWLFLLQVIAASRSAGSCCSRQPAGRGRCRRRLRAQHARRVPADGAVRAFRLPGGADDCWHRGRDHRGRRVRRARRLRGAAQAVRASGRSAEARLRPRLAGPETGGTASARSGGVPVRRPWPCWRGAGSPAQAGSARGIRPCPPAASRAAGAAIGAAAADCDGTSAGRPC